MSACQSKIDKKTNSQMKNHANFSFQRPKDFITVFGPHVISEFPHLKLKVSPSVRQKIVISRVQATPDKSKQSLSLKDIFYRGG
jgi:hypothetical protein